MRVSGHCSMWLVVVSCAVSSGWTRQSAVKPPPEMRTFTDPDYAYSLRVPRAWRTNLADANAGRSYHLSLVTPQQNRFFVTVLRLPIFVTRRTPVETVGQTYVDPMLQHYLKSFGLRSGIRKTDDQSDAQSMRLWQEPVPWPVLARLRC